MAQSENVEHPLDSQYGGSKPEVLIKTLQVNGAYHAVYLQFCTG